MKKPTRFMNLYRLVRRAAGTRLAKRLEFAAPRLIDCAIEDISEYIAQVVWIRGQEKWYGRRSWVGIHEPVDGKVTVDLMRSRDRNISIVIPIDQLGHFIRTIFTL